MVLDPAEWRARSDAHGRRVDVLTAGHRARRRDGTAHPVEDFLFTYYSYRPGQLRRWHPGTGALLAGADPAGFGPHHTTGPDGLLGVDVAGVLRRRRTSIAWIRTLLASTAGRAAQFGCFGMHEWAMVYRQPAGQVRHANRPLRLGSAGTDEVLERLGARCTHFDAYRFFTPAARPVNALPLTRAGQADHEQPGCLHAGMDVYRFAYKLVPLTPAELVADCFELAREIRVLDMRASPYDLTDLGFEPVRVETPEGRTEYVRQQRGFASRAATLRGRLIDLCDEVLAGAPAEGSTDGSLSAAR